jgi:hypothetical protein
MHRGRENPLPLALIAIRNNLSQRGGVHGSSRLDSSVEMCDEYG